MSSLYCFAALTRVSIVFGYITSSGENHFNQLPFILLIPRFSDEASPWFSCENILILSEKFSKISREESSEPSSTTIISILSYV